MGERGKDNFYPSKMDFFGLFQMPSFKCCMMLEQIDSFFKGSLSGFFGNSISKWQRVYEAKVIGEGKACQKEKGENSTPCFTTTTMLVH